MTTLTIQITDEMKKFVERRIASGGFEDGSAVVQALFDVAMLADRRKEIDQKLLEAADRAERGECAPWHAGDARKLWDEIVHQRMPKVEA